MPSSTSTTSISTTTAVVGPSTEPHYASLHTAYTRLQASHARLTTELKTLQETDYARTQTRAGPAHRTIAAQFNDLFSQITAWARDYFKHPLATLPAHLLFQKHVERVVFGNGGQRTLNVSHLAQAVAGDIVTRRIIALPFPGCPEGVRTLFMGVFDGMRREHEARARRWRADTFVAYMSGRERVGSEEVVRELEEILGPVATSCVPGHDMQERVRRARAFVEAAGELAGVLASQAARLEVLDRTWFRRARRKFVCGDERMEGRLGEQEEEDEGTFRVDAVLRPGFLKCGNDEGENLGEWAVWIPALLEVNEEGAEEEEGGYESDGSYEDALEFTENVGRLPLPNGHTAGVSLSPAEPQRVLEAAAEPVPGAQTGEGTKERPKRKRRAKLWKPVKKVLLMIRRKGT